MLLSDLIGPTTRLYAKSEWAPAGPLWPALMQRISDVDEEAGRVNGSAPPGVSDRLLGVELVARGLDRLVQPEVSIPRELRLPHLDRRGGPLLAWPPPQPSLAVQTAATTAVPFNPLFGPDWQAALEERDRQLGEESERLSAYYEERERGAEKRREAEVRQAHGQQHRS